MNKKTVFGIVLVVALVLGVFVFMRLRAGANCKPCDPKQSGTTSSHQTTQATPVTTPSTGSPDKLPAGGEDV